MLDFDFLIRLERETRKAKAFSQPDLKKKVFKWKATSS